MYPGSGVNLFCLSSRFLSAQPPGRSQLTLDQLRSETTAAGLLLFPLMAGFIGMAIGAIDFFVQMCGRTIAWGLAGMSMGLGQGIALRSKRLFLYGLLGGIIGGLLGGLIFDPIDLIKAKKRNTAKGGQPAKSNRLW